MKKITFLMITAIIIAGNAFAQPVRDQRRETALQTERQREAAAVNVNGTLKLERGFVAVQGQDNTVYLVPMLNRFIGFITGLREGASVSIEGFQVRNIINPTKVTIDGQSYDFRRLAQNNMSLNYDHRNFSADRRGNPGHNKENFGHDRNNRNQKNKHSNCNCRNE